jgi:chromosome segregation protein
VFNRRQGDAQRQADVERTRIEHLDRQLLQGGRRLERLQLEARHLADTEAGDEEVADLAATEQTLAERLQHDQESFGPD